MRFDPDVGGVMVPVELSDNSRLFMLDTGTSLSCFDVALRKELGDPLRSVEVRAPDGGLHEAAIFAAPRAAVAGLPMDRDLEVLCMDFATFRANAGVDCYGLIGMDFMRHRIVQIDFDRGEVQFMNRVPQDVGTAVPIDLPTVPGLPKVIFDVPGIGPRPFKVDTGYR